MNANGTEQERIMKPAKSGVVKAGRWAAVAGILAAGAVMCAAPCKAQAQQAKANGVNPVSMVEVSSAAQQPLEWTVWLPRVCVLRISTWKYNAHLPARPS
jgi:hypothetical protein